MAPANKNLHIFRRGTDDTIVINFVVDEKALHVTKHL